MLKKRRKRVVELAENSPLVARKRDYWFDNIKGVLMILVVIGHMTASFYTSSAFMKYVYDLINAMHMGAFLILSGYLSKRRVDSNDVVSVINKNVIPYITSQFFLYFAAVIIPDGLKAANVSYFSKSDFSIFVPIYQLWYLMALIILTLLTMKLKPSRKPVLFMVGAIMLTLLCGCFQQVNVLKLTKIISYYPFFLLGYLLPEDFMHTIRNKWQVLLGAVPVLIGYAFFMTRQDWIVGIRKIYFLSSTYEKVGDIAFGLHPVFGRLFMVLFVPVIAFAFFAVIPRKKCIFTKLGRNSMSIFVLHGVVAVVLRCLNYEYKIFSYFNTPVLKLLFLFGCVAVAFVLGTDFVKKLFRPVLEPDFDITRVVGILYDKYRGNQKKADNI